MSVVPIPPRSPLDRERFEALVAEGYDQVPLVRSVELHGSRPVDLLRALPSGQRFLLESTRVSNEGRYSFVGARPFLTFRARGARCEVNGEPQPGEPLATLRGLLGRWRGVRLPGMPLFCGGAVGFFAYEASHYFESLPRHRNDDLGLPDIALDFVDTFVAVDHLEDRALVVATGRDYEDCLQRVEALERVVRTVASTGLREPAWRLADGQTPDVSWRSNFTQEGYQRAVERVQEYIRAGDTYQVNLSQRLEVEPRLPALELYEALSSISPVHFASYLEVDGFEVVSASPERLVRVEDGRAITRPIAGTRRKGTPEENARFAHELRTSEKERAEHAMLVDLERNDLGRVCAYGSVQVTKLMEIIEYAHVLHIESEVVGRLAPGVAPLDVVAAVFPGGTITGVPKIRTMQLITELEPHARGLYTGSLGYVSFTGELDLNIVIRTMVLKGGRAWVQVGAGIVHDSEPRREYQETLHKARSLLLALSACPVEGTA
ncbi:Para-aminobenzoate synthase, aminase component [Cystobacter fuscus DSM 2262]|uniref:Para-aminobenzoate synthase, aminase component n=1 Tax=Cystobacter fuscus (strain ATCC 25194 / DSM 2262 / NBRC 100088 / M29) TaxID=1242864 RepID=S9PPF6_CYSF2|nr:anthranilate synthase component I family protein [Cystobacter fuscus]EPX64931.1 Para-aminobenzoate synthase, aminase component [Cystobacter fuscus DSM 2262]